MPYPIPTVDEEALQEPTIEPSDLRSMATGAAKWLFSMKDLAPLLALMRTTNKRSPYLPPEWELESNFSPTMPSSYYSRPLPRGGDLQSGETLMRHGFDPHGPGWSQSWAPKNHDIDYMPPQVRDSHAATRYMQNWLRQHIPHSYGPTDDGLMGTPNGNRLDELYGK